MKRSARRKLGSRAWWVLLLAVLMLATWTGQASAHAFLLRTDPPDGSVLASGPSQMRFWFSEPLEIDLTTVSLQDGDNHTWQLQPRADASDPSIVLVDLPELPGSAYRVSWRTVSDEDGHIVSGFVVFGIGQAVSREASAQPRSATSFAEVAFRWIGLLASTTMIGVLVMLLFLFPPLRRNLGEEQAGALASLQGKMRLSMLWCCVIAFFAGLLLLWLKSVNIEAGAGSIRGIDWRLVTSLANSAFGRRELASEACLILFGLLTLAWINRERAAEPRPAPPASKKMGVILFSIALLWVFLQALNSHASAFNAISPIRVIAYAMHILGAGLWIGGQVALLLLVAARLHARDNQYALARATYAQFGGIAALGVAILIVTGLYSAGQQVASLDALLLTAYGQTLLLKTFLVILTGLIGLRHASHFHSWVARILHSFISPRAGIIIFGKVNPAVTLRWQLLGGVVIVLLASFLGASLPARGPAFEAPVAAATTVLPSIASSSMADDLLVNFSIKPNRPGQNFVTVGVFDTRRPAPAPVEQVLVKLLPAGKQDAIQLDTTLSEKDGTYQASTAAIDLSGDWQVAVIVQRAGMQEAVMTSTWTVGTAAPSQDRPTLLSARPLAPWLTAASVCLFILFAATWLVVSLRPRLPRRADRKAISSR